MSGFSGRQEHRGHRPLRPFHIRTSDSSWADQTGFDPAKSPYLPFAAPASSSQEDILPPPKSSARLEFLEPHPQQYQYQCRLVPALAPRNAKPRKLDSRSRRFLRLAYFGLVRWAISLLLVGGFFLAITFYQGIVLDPTKKSTFDALIVALSIALGLNVAAALKSSMKQLLWWLISKNRSKSEERLLLAHVDSLSELMRVAWRSPRSAIAFILALWVGVAMLMQTAIAVVSLTYETDPGVADIYIENKLSQVSVANMSQFGEFFDPNPILNNHFSDSLAAHIFGSTGGSYNYSTLPEKPLANQPYASNPASYWNATDHWEYHFLRSEPTSRSISGINFVSVYTDRVARSSAVCETPAVTALSTSDTLAYYTVHSPDGSNRTTAFPLLATNGETVYYITDPYIKVLPNDTDTTNHCGPGCSTVEVLEPYAGPPAEGSLNPDNGVNNGFYYYVCNITVSMALESGGGGDDDDDDEIDEGQEPYMPPLNRAVAAQSIALSGQIASEYYLANDTSQVPARTQFSGYNLGLQFGQRMNNSTPDMERLVSQYAISTVAAAAQSNPRVLVPGHAPRQGVRLVLEHQDAFVIIFALTIAVQLGVVLLAAYLASLRSPDAGLFGE